jgi:hypothetical protein
MIKNTASGWGHACKVKGRGAHMSIRNIRCWNASLNLLIRRFKPLAASTHKKTPTS